MELFIIIFFLYINVGGCVFGTIHSRLNLKAFIQQQNDDGDYCFTLFDLKIQVRLASQQTNYK